MNFIRNRNFFNHSLLVNYFIIADLIALMDKYGIGTDATHAEHIETIKTRQYAALNNDGRFVPGYIGLALVDGYDRMGYAMSKPHMRANLESQLKLICLGERLNFSLVYFHFQFAFFSDRFKWFSEDLFEGYY